MFQESLTDHDGAGPSTNYTPAFDEHDPRSFLRTDGDAIRAWENLELLEILSHAGFRPKASWFVLKLETKLGQGMTVLKGTYDDVGDLIKQPYHFVRNRVREIKSRPCLMFIQEGFSRKRRKDEAVPEGMKTYQSDQGELIAIPSRFDFKPLYQHRSLVGKKAIEILHSREQFTSIRNWNTCRFDIPQEERERVWQEAVKSVDLPAVAPKIARNSGKKAQEKTQEPPYSITRFMREVKTNLAEDEKIDTRDAALGRIAAWALSQLPTESADTLLAGVLGCHVETTTPDEPVEVQNRTQGSSRVVETTTPESEQNLREKEKDDGLNLETFVPMFGQQWLVENPDNANSIEAGRREPNLSSFSRSSSSVSFESSPTGPSIVERIEALAETLEVNRLGMAHCPCHEDRTPSLHVTERDGGVMMFCHSCGKNGAQIVEEIEGGGYQPPVHPKSPVQGDSGAKGRLVATYIHRTTEGVPVYKLQRYEPKGFSLWRYEDGSWKIGLTRENGTKVEEIPYGLDRLAKSNPDDVVYLVEGEKSADLLTKRGFLSLAVGGANKWEKHFAEALRGRRVFIVPDHDEPGAKMAFSARCDMLEIGIDVDVIQLEGLDEGEDIHDWIVRHGHSATDLRIVAGEPCSSCHRTLDECLCLPLDGLVN